VPPLDPFRVALGFGLLLVGLLEQALDLFHGGDTYLLASCVAVV